MDKFKKISSDAVNVFPILIFVLGFLTLIIQATGCSNGVGVRVYEA